MSMQRISPSTYQWWKDQQLMLYTEAARRARAAKQRVLGFAFCFALSCFLPAPWSTVAWCMSVALGVAAFWSSEQSVVARRQAQVSIYD